MRTRAAVLRGLNEKWNVEVEENLKVQAEEKEKAEQPSS